MSSEVDILLLADDAVAPTARLLACSHRVGTVAHSANGGEALDLCWPRGRDQDRAGRCWLVPDGRPLDERPQER